MPLGEDEIVATVDEVKKSIPLGERAHLFSGTGHTTKERTRRDLIGLFQAEHARQLAEKQQRGSAMASIDQARIKEGLPPLGGGYAAPEAQQALAPLQEILLKRRAEKEQAAATARRVEQRKAIGKTDPTKWNVQDMIDWDEGRLHDRNLIRPVDPLTQIKTIKQGGHEFVQAPLGFKMILLSKPVKPPGPTPEEKDNAAANKSELAGVRRGRMDIGSKVSELEGEAQAAQEFLTEQEALPPAKKNDDEILKAQAALRTAKSKMRSLASRDKGLSTREDELRTAMGGKSKAAAPEYVTGKAGTRQNVRLPDDLEPHMTDDPIDEPAVAQAYIMKLAGIGLKRAQIATLLAQHTELDREDLDGLDQWMQTQGIK